MAVLIHYWAAVLFLLGVALAVYARFVAYPAGDRGWLLLSLLMMSVGGWFWCGSGVWQAVTN